MTLPAYVWEALLQCVGKDDRKTYEELLQKLELRADKKAIATELKKGSEVPGADLKFGDMRLVLS